MFRKEKGGNPDLIRKSEKNRFKDASKVDLIIDLDQQ